MGSEWGGLWALSAELHTQQTLCEDAGWTEQGPGLGMAWVPGGAGDGMGASLFP